MIVFIDPVCPTPYCADELTQGGIGGTEATVIRVAAGLNAVVAQHCRTDTNKSYIPYSAVSHANHLVILRKPHALLEWHARLPTSKPYLWLHDLISPNSRQARELVETAPTLTKIGARIICVSNFHRTQIAAALDCLPVEFRPHVQTIYNPIADDLQPRERPYDPFKLVFASQPRKGLDIALAAFRHIHTKDDRYRLHVANPGYRDNAMIKQPGVMVLGALPHAVLLDEMSTALCVFYPNFYYPETFGLVFAESNALGVPVLTHPIGAAAEVLSNSAQLLPVNSRLLQARSLSQRTSKSLLRHWILQVGGRRAFANYHRIIREWSDNGRPTVSGKEKFRLSHVTMAWKKLFFGEQ